MLGQGHTTKRRQKRDVSQSAEEQPCLGGGRGLGMLAAEETQVGARSRQESRASLRGPGVGLGQWG